MGKYVSNKKAKRHGFLIFLLNVVFLAGAAYAYAKVHLLALPNFASQSAASSYNTSLQSSAGRKEDKVGREISSKSSSQVKSNSSEKIIDVPYISQEGSYSTGCELVSASMVLQYYGCHASVEDVVKNTPYSDLQQKDGKFYGDDPTKSFIGDPTSESGFGCYAPVVVSVMNTFLSKSNKIAVNITGNEFNSLIPYIQRGDPVIVWATMRMLPTYQGNSWIINGTGKTFVWPAREHCLVFVGYNKDKYYFNDPYKTSGLADYTKSVVEQRYNDLGKQAVIVEDKP
ncbi:MAG TPA: hypothetical protein DG942_04150 [Ruminococcaceae bacterium]|jgi:uncharacterized protein YvpB|nr:hypothetical protein [Oscillospiraceae bacterium]